MKFQTPWNHSACKGETFTEPSQTQPDMSMSIRDILLRFASTGDVDGVAVHNPEYDIDQDVEFFDVPDSSFASDVAELLPPLSDPLAYSRSGEVVDRTADKRSDVPGATSTTETEQSKPSSSNSVKSAKNSVDTNGHNSEE